jgi:hypothetical protein
VYSRHTVHRKGQLWSNDHEIHIWQILWRALNHDHTHIRNMRYRWQQWKPIWDTDVVGKLEPASSWWRHLHLLEPNGRRPDIYLPLCRGKLLTSYSIAARQTYENISRVLCRPLAGGTIPVSAQQQISTRICSIHRSAVPLRPCQVTRGLQSETKENSTSSSTMIGHSTKP